jgi:hypothetical protein
VLPVMLVVGPVTLEVTGPVVVNGIAPIPDKVVVELVCVLEEITK